MIDDAIIAKVFKNKSNGQKLITVPSACEIINGDYVKLIKVKVEGKQK